MADVKISALPAATAAAADEVPANHAGVTSKLTGQGIADLKTWANLTGKPATFPPDIHDNTAHTTGVVPVNVTKAAAAEGTSVAIARADHKHDATTAVAGASAFADVAAEGTATSLARSDHKHGREANPVTFGSPVASNFDDTASDGVSPNVPRADHRHARETNPVTAHVAASDPHTQYQREIEKDAASGYAGLDASTLLSTAEHGTGTANVTRVLRGDRTWDVPSIAHNPGTFTLPDGRSFNGAKTFILTGSTRATIQGTSRLRIN